MTDKKIRETIEDLAEYSGKTAEEYLAALVGDMRKARDDKYSSLPEDAAKELADADRLRDDNRKAKREKAESDDFDKQLAEFVKRYPDVKADDIPEKVWLDVADGIPLVYAYAYRVSSVEEDPSEKVNAENELRKLKVNNDKTRSPAYTEAEVGKMSASDVKGNFNKIINSMKKWKV